MGNLDRQCITYILYAITRTDALTRLTNAHEYSHRNTLKPTSKIFWLETLIFAVLQVQKLSPFTLSLSCEVLYTNTCGLCMAPEFHIFNSVTLTVKLNLASGIKNWSFRGSFPWNVISHQRDPKMAFSFIKLLYLSHSAFKLVKLCDLQKLTRKKVR